MAASASSASGTDAERVAGQVFTWGRGSDGQLGQDRVCHPGTGKLQSCALPHPVPGLERCVFVACGGGQQGCTMAVGAEGQLWVFGNNYGGRLGLGHERHVREPTLLEWEGRPFIRAVACGSSHAVALGAEGSVWTWGRAKSALGRDTELPLVPGLVEGLPGPATMVDAEHQCSGCLVGGKLFVWGENDWGQLGVGDTAPRTHPVAVEIAGYEEGHEMTSFSLGSTYAGAVTEGGELFMWGWGGHGNLGLGKRLKAVTAPRRVLGDLESEHVVQVACTRGQTGFKGGPSDAAKGGAEGPHTVVITRSGGMFTFGTCHKGLCCNLGSKDGAFGRAEWDELSPYRVGSAVRNGTKHPPLSPHGVWPPPYDAVGPFVSAVSGHIHAAAVSSMGTAWAWGCGSNDGRCGVERFLNMHGDGRPPAVDSMKCYLMNPHQIGVARKPYWPYGPSLAGWRVEMLATGRNHMAAIATPCS
jgi:alpha-tubulin suppressor-like RCC1 family protein